MPGIFLSYRRADSDGWAGRLRDALRVRFGDLVFQDVDNIPDGEIFSDVIDRALQECDVALIVIGPNWASARDEHGQRRLDNEDDWVRIETREVLNHKHKIRVIPVLVGGAALPRAADLPEELRPLTKRQAREVRSNTWDSDVALLSKQLEQIVRRRKRPVWVYVAPAAAIALGVGVFAGNRLMNSTTPAPAPPEPSASGPAPPATTVSAPTAPTVSAPTAASAPAPPRASAPAPPPQTREVPVAASTASQPSKTAPSEPAKEPPKQAPVVPSARTAAAPPPKVSVAAAPATRPPPPSASSAVPEARTSVAAPADTEAPTERVAVTPRVIAGSSARSATLNLPNRPATSRELKIGDSWTYRLREVRLNRNLALVTHEIGGGDGGGIREMLRVSEPRSSVTERRLPLEPRIFEQQLDQNATLFEFAPFLTAFSDLQPGLRWSRIAGAMNADASTNEWRFSGKVAGREAVRVPAGSFDAIRAELEGQRESSFPSSRNDYVDATPAYQAYSIWFVPEIGRAVKYERRTYNRVRRLLEHEQYELVSYQPK